MQTVVIGTGSGYSGSRVEHALDLIANAELDYLVFETLGERTVAKAQLARWRNPDAGYDPYLDSRMRKILGPALERGIRIVTNMGGANPRAAASRIKAIAAELGVREPRVCMVLGDDVREIVREADLVLQPSGRRVSQLGGSLVAANAYIGAEPIVRGLAEGADIVIGGRIADPSLFVGCLAHAHGWALDDPALIGRATVVGHLLECSSQVTGGYFADPPYTTVTGLDRVAFPVAEVGADGSAVVSIPQGLEGIVDERTCALQLLYEIGDPSRYLTPDVTADFTTVRFSELASNKVQVTGGGGSAAPPTLKVTVGYFEGYLGEAEISYGGPGCLARARLAAEVLAARIDRDEIAYRQRRFDIIGWDALFGPPPPGTPEPPEVRLRVSAWCDTEEDAAEIGREVEALYASGPAAGGGVRQNVTQRLVVEDAFVPRVDVPLQAVML